MSAKEKMPQIIPTVTSKEDIGSKSRYEQSSSSSPLSSKLDIPNSEIIKKMIADATANLQPCYKRNLEKILEINPTNAYLISKFIIAEMTEINIRDSTKEWRIKILSALSGFYDHHQKIFPEMVKQDIISFLNKGRKSEEDDPTHKRIGTYNNKQKVCLKFFRWLYNEDESDHRKRITPSCMQGIRELPRKEVSPYEPPDLWTKEETKIFLRHCPSKRDRCYCAMAVEDTSARPVELLRLKVQDISFRIADETGMQYAEVSLQSGKSKTRTVPLFFPSHM
jgi:integrase